MRRRDFTGRDHSDRAFHISRIIQERNSGETRHLGYYDFDVRVVEREWGTRCPERRRRVGRQKKPKQRSR
jgi:hypothetical protein